jgi:hypothetical protein
MEIKFNWLDALIVAIVAPLVVGIILIIFQCYVEKEDCIIGNSTTPTTPIIGDQLKELQNPTAPFKVAMWINSPGLTQFTTEDKTTLYYKVSDLPKDKTVYFTLFNISPVEEVSILLLNKPIQGDILYSIPEEAQPASGEDKPIVVIQQQFDLEKGLEYFRAIVTSKALEKEKFLAAHKEALRQHQWETESLTVKVIDSD